MRRVFFFLLFLVTASQAQSRVVDFSKPDDAKIAQPYGAPGGVTSGATVELEKRARWFFRNRAPGFVWRAALGGRRSMSTKITDVEFDFKASPDARVNWFFRVGKNYYGVHFTGPESVRAGATLLGSVETTELPNGWRHAHIPLRAWLRSQSPTQSSLVIDEILIGNWDNDGYLMAGIGGNGPGAWWQMDNLKLEKRTETAKIWPGPL